MGKKLALRGHESRGKEVIKILEMMGGHATVINKISNETDKVFFISDNENCFYRKSIRFIPDSSKEIEEFNVFTLEEFLEKYPFKVGDKVVYTKFGDNCDDYPLIIKSMKWTGTTIEYAFDGYVTCLAKDLKMWTGEPDAAISGIYLNSCDYADEVELNLGDYEIEVRDGRTYAVKKKSKYPTTYEDCCKNVFGLVHEGMTVDVPMNYSPLIINFTKLLICRDAYWKVSGEKMGLDGPWNPDWKNTKNVKYGITLHDDIITKMYLRNENVILAFPTEEMRYAFYENFKDLIESCKELL